MFDSANNKMIIREQSAVTYISWIITGNTVSAVGAFRPVMMSRLLAFLPFISALSILPLRKPTIQKIKLIEFDK